MTTAKQTVIDTAAQTILASEELRTRVVFGDGGFKVVETLTVNLEINQSKVPVKFAEGFYTLSASAQNLVGFDALLVDSPNPLLMEGLEELQTEDGMIVFKPATVPTKQSGGISCLGLLVIIVVFFGGFILIAPPLLSLLLNLMSGPMQHAATNILCSNPSTKQEIVQVVRAEMRVSGTRSSSSSSVSESPVVTTNSGVEYLAAGDACSTPDAIKSLPTSGILFKFNKLNAPYLVKTRPVTMFGQTIQNIETATELTPEEAAEVQKLLNRTGTISNSQLSEIQQAF